MCVLCVCVCVGLVGLTWQEAVLLCFIHTPDEPHELIHHVPARMSRNTDITHKTKGVYQTLLLNQKSHHAKHSVVCCSAAVPLAVTMDAANIYQPPTQPCLRKLNTTAIPKPKGVSPVVVGWLEGVLSHSPAGRKDHKVSHGHTCNNRQQHGTTSLHDSLKSRYLICLVECFIQHC